MPLLCVPPAVILLAAAWQVKCVDCWMLQVLSLLVPRLLQRSLLSHLLPELGKYLIEAEQSIHLAGQSQRSLTPSCQHSLSAQQCHSHPAGMGTEHSILVGEISLLGPPLGTVDADLGFQMGAQVQGKPRDAQKQARQHAASQEARSQLGTLIGQSQPWQQACISSARLPARVPHLLSYNPCICTCSCIILRHLLALLLKVRRPNNHAYDMQPAKARLRPPVLQG